MHPQNLQKEKHKEKDKRREERQPEFKKKRNFVQRSRKSTLSFGFPSDYWIIAKTFSLNIVSGSLGSHFPSLIALFEFELLKSLRLHCNTLL